MNNKNPSRSEIRSTFFPKFDAGEFDGISGNSVDSGKSGEFGDTGESVHPGESGHSSECGDSGESGESGEIIPANNCKTYKFSKIFFCMYSMYV